MTIGSIIAWGSDTLPTGWLLCDGSAVSRTTYADLFAVIGTNFGIGDGSTTFNLPDLRGRVGVGKSSDTEFDTLGETGGEKKHTLTINEMPSHTHMFKFSKEIAEPTYSSGNIYFGLERNYNAGDNSNHTESTGGGQAHNILQPYIVTNYIIKALVDDKVKISELESAVSIDGTEVMPIVQSGVTKKITANNLLSEVYSTNEVKTNKIWIDGKPIYRKVVHISSLPNNTSTSYDTGISNGNLTYFEAEGKLTSNDENKVKFPYISPYSNEGTITMSIKEDASKINFATFRDRTSGYADIVLEYSKTTD